jgi:hypothetical protein
VVAYPGCSDPMNDCYNGVMGDILGHGPVLGQSGHMIDQITSAVNDEILVDLKLRLDLRFFFWFCVQKIHLLLLEDCLFCFFSLLILALGSNVPRVTPIRYGEAMPYGGWSTAKSPSF